MLKFMRKKTSSIFIQGAFFIIIAVFVFWGIGGLRGSRGSVVAKIDDTVISQASFLKAYRSQIKLIKQRYGDAFSDKMLEDINLKENVLDTLINRAVILKEAKKMDISISDEELLAKIKSIPAFQDNGYFSKRRYLYLLRNEGLTPAKFEKSVRDDMIIEKITSIITDSVKTSGGEIRTLFDTRYRKINLKFMKIDALPFLKEIKPSDTEIKEYFDANKESFKLPRGFEVNYLVLDPSNFKEEVTVSDEEIADYYDQNISEFKEKKGDKEETFPLNKVSKSIKDILIKNKSLDLAIEKANNIVDATIKEAVSLGDAAKKEGLDIKNTGLFYKGSKANIVAANQELLDNVTSLDSGEVSNPVTMDGKVYILELANIVEEHIPPFEDAKDKAALRLTINKANLKAREIAFKLLKNLKDGEAFAQVAKNKGLKVGKTGFFSRLQSTVSGLNLPVSMVEQKAFQLSLDANRYAVLKGGNTYFVVELIGKMEPAEDEFNAHRIEFTKEVEKIKKDELLNAWLLNVKSKTDININRDAI